MLGLLALKGFKMANFAKISLSLTACYGAAVIGMMAAVSHYFSAHLDGKALSSLISSLALLAFQTLALLALSAYVEAKYGQHQPTNPAAKWLLLIVLCCWHLGTWLFTYTVWAGLFALPLHFSGLAPLGGQLLLLSWVVLALTPWIGKTQ